MSFGTHACILNKDIVTHTHTPTHTCMYALSKDKFYMFLLMHIEDSTFKKKFVYFHIYYLYLYFVWFIYFLLFLGYDFVCVYLFPTPSLYIKVLIGRWCMHIVYAFNEGCIP